MVIGVLILLAYAALIYAIAGLSGANGKDKDE